MKLKKIVLAIGKSGLTSTITIVGHTLVSWKIIVKGIRSANWLITPTRKGLNKNVLLSDFYKKKVLGIELKEEWKTSSV